MFGLVVILNTFKSLDLITLSTLTPFAVYHSTVTFVITSTGVVDLVVFTLFVGAMAKSSQVSLHT